MYLSGFYTKIYIT